jgi:predicted nucleic acid-binding protein
MDIVIDTSALIAVIVDEPERNTIIELVSIHKWGFLETYKSGHGRASTQGVDFWAF